ACAGHPVPGGGARHRLPLLSLHHHPPGPGGGAAGQAAVRSPPRLFSTTGTVIVRIGNRSRWRLASLGFPVARLSSPSVGLECPPTSEHARNLGGRGSSCRSRTRPSS